MATTLTLGLERCIATAHRAVLRAAYLAESMIDQGYAEDLHQVARELQRLQESLLRRN